MFHNIDLIIFVKVVFSVAYIAFLLRYMKYKIESGLTTYKDFYMLFSMSIILIIILFI